ncbi:CrcB-like protein-domain-containing protein, partial [Phlyctochytrium arcticum]
GTFVRYRLAGQNSKYAHFPAGTFLVNVGGSVILGALYITTRTVELPPNACHAINGLSDGFCGCLTTVSTFVVELYTLPRPRAYVYALSSIVAAQIPLIIILGVPHWTGNLTSSCQNLS